MTHRIVATAKLPDRLEPDARQRVCEALAALEHSNVELTRSHAGLHVDGSVGGGDLTWDLALPDAAAVDALARRTDEEGWAGLFASSAHGHREALSALSQIEAWLVEPLAAHASRPERVGIKRTNLVRVVDSAAPEAVARWTREVPGLAEKVPAIRNWSLARVRPIGPTSPRVRWTHAWEQEFERIEGLVEDYMASPYHWGHLDGWYDPEMPHCIVDPDLAHLYCPATTSVLSWTEDAR